MTNRHPKVEAFLQKEKKWKEEFEALREILLTHSLVEEFKWRVPCYTYEERNVVLMHGFKEYCALLFVKGSLLRDEVHILISQTHNTQASRQIRFIDVNKIVEVESALHRYIEEAIKLEKEGNKVEFKKASEFSIPIEFQQKLDESVQLKTAFHSLTQGRQRAYLLYFASSKLSKTRVSRIEKYIKHIL